MNPDNNPSKKKLFTPKIIGPIVVVLVLAALAVVVWNLDKQQAANNYAECAAAGGEVTSGTESICEIDGKTFKDSDAANPDDKGAANTKIGEAYLGMSEKDALEKAKTDDRQARVVSRDGKGLMVTMDLRPGRLNFTIEDGVVTEVEEEAPNAKKNLSE